MLSAFDTELSFGEKLVSGGILRTFLAIFVRTDLYCMNMKFAGRSKKPSSFCNNLLENS